MGQWGLKGIHIDQASHACLQFDNFFGQIQGAQNLGYGFEMSQNDPDDPRNAFIGYEVPQHLWLKAGG